MGLYKHKQILTNILKDIKLLLGDDNYTIDNRKLNNVRKRVKSFKEIIDLFKNDWIYRKEELKLKVNKNDYETIINLFRKVIASLVSIEKTTKNNNIKKITDKYLKDIIIQYENYRSTKNLNKVQFKYSEKEIVDFSNDCYDKVDIFTFAEDVEFGFSELVNKILKGRENKNNE